MTTRLTADEITTFAEVLGHELTEAQLTHLEGWVDAHRAEAVVMFIDEMTAAVPLRAFIDYGNGGAA